MKAKELLVEFYEMSDDRLAQWDYDDTRRPRLTFGQLHKMRLAKDAERADNAEHMSFLPTMYGQPSGEGGL